MYTHGFSSRKGLLLPVILRLFGTFGSSKCSDDDGDTEEGFDRTSSMT